MGSDININDTENNKENAMSIWHTIKDKNDVGISDDGKTIEIAFMEDYNGAIYVDVPIEFIKEILQANPLDALVSHVCGEQELKKKILNKFIDRVTYYEKQKLTLPRSEKLKSRIRELKYMMKEIDNIFFENDSRPVGKLVSQKTADTLQQDIIDLLKRIQQIATDTIWMDELGSETVAERLMAMYSELGGDENKIKFMYDSRFSV